MENSIGITLFKYLPFTRGWVIRFCHEIDPKHFTEVHSLALADRSIQVRYEAIQSITRNMHWTSIDPVIAALRDRDAKVRMAAVQSLSQFGTPRSVGALFKLLHDPVPLIRAEAVSALRKHPKRKFQKQVQELVQDRQENVRQSALETLLTIRCSDEFVSTLLNLALDAAQPLLIRKLAFENMRLAERLPVSMLERMEKIGQDNNSVALHLEIVKVIAAYPPGKQMQTMLIQFLHHISDDVHRAAVQALGEKGDRGAIFYLSKLVEEGYKRNQLMNRYDSRLAELAIKKISSRYP